MSTDQRLFLLGLRGAGQHRSGAGKREISCCVLPPKHDKTGNLKFDPRIPIPESRRGYIGSPIGFVREEECGGLPC